MSKALGSIPEGKRGKGRGRGREGEGKERRKERKRKTENVDLFGHLSTFYFRSSF
jgi:hypothetical protein